MCGYRAWRGLPRALQGGGHRGSLHSLMVVAGKWLIEAAQDERQGFSRGRAIAIISLCHLVFDRSGVGDGIMRTKDEENTIDYKLRLATILRTALTSQGDGLATAAALHGCNSEVFSAGHMAPYGRAMIDVLLLAVERFLLSRAHVVIDSSSWDFP